MTEIKPSESSDETRYHSAWDVRTLTEALMTGLALGTPEDPLAGVQRLVALPVNLGRLRHVLAAVVEAAPLVGALQQRCAASATHQALHGNRRMASAARQALCGKSGKSPIK